MLHEGLRCDKQCSRYKVYHLPKIRGTGLIMDLDWTAIIFNLIGGLGMFMYGMRSMSSGLQELAGERIKQLFGLLTNNRLMGVLVGLGVTALIQSSSATSVLLVGFLNAGLMELSQSVGIIMGANIGTTITSWIIVIKITRYALLILGLGVAMHLFSKNSAMKVWGQLLLGFGMLFFGLTLMETAFYPFRESPDFMPFFAQFGADNPGQIIKSVFAGLLLTLVVQSSSTTIGITIALANQGLISYAGAAALVLGENIGTTITMNLAAIGTNTESRRAARIHLLFNSIGVVYMIALFPWFIQLVEVVVPGTMDYVAADGTKPHIAAHIAAGHSIFNIFNTLVFLPAAGILIRVATWLVPGKKEKAEKHLEFIDYSFISVPSLAIGEAKKEIVKMSEFVTNMFKWTESLLFSPGVDRGLSDKLFKYENITDRIQHEISHFLARLLQSSPGPQVAEDTRRYLRIAEEYESIGDFCEMLAKFAIRKEQQHIIFSNEATEGLLVAHHELLSYITLCTLSFVEERPRMLHEVVSRSKSLQKTIKHLRNAHIDRLDRQECDVTAGLLYTDILATFQNIRSHARNIGEAIAGFK
jgi:phosphate:Na+ symporter